MDIKVINEGSSPACSEADYVHVQMWSDPEQDTLTLATIERVVRKSNVKPAAPARRVKTLVEKQPMSLDAAVGFATLYAASKKIQVVLTTASEEAS